ncbi:MAG: FAD:protein FMN transferase [Acidaminococcaceae bacterium]|nr:FAD:protein FMN transferase [Acidaminococcaceae bacterium]
MFIKTLFIFWLSLSVILSGCAPIAPDKAGKKEVPVARDFFAMDTYCKITAYGANAEKAADAAQKEIRRLEALVSSHAEDSEVSRLAKNRSAVVSVDTAALLSQSLALHEETGGAFDITLAPVSQCWGFPHGPYHAPDEAEIKNALAKTGMSFIRWEAGTRNCTLDGREISLDFGGIAKGYAAEKMTEKLAQDNISSAIINLGGNVKAVGAKPDGSSWRVGLQHPDEKESYLGILSVTDTSVVTSGDYERYFIKDNVRYHHILDPKTGMPAQNGTRSVTIVCRDCTLADGLSTALFVMGPGAAIKFWQSHRDRFQFIMFAQDKTLYVSEGLLPVFATKLTVTPVK